MADNIKNILTDLIKTKGAIGSLKSGIESLNKMTADVSLDPKALNQLQELQKVLVSQAAATEELNAATEKFNELQKELSDTSKKSNEEIEEIVKKRDKQLRQINNLSQKTEKYQRIVVRSGKNIASAEEDVTKKVLEANEKRVEAWKKNTLAGKSYSALTSNIAKFAAGATFATMGMKALSRFTDAARLRNNLMIASYGDLNDNLVQAGISVYQYESAMRGAQATAKYLGMENEDVSGIMLKYQRIVGKTTPEALGALTEATLATAKVLGIDGSEAVGYVSAKLNNFGGTAQSALDSLKELRDETQKYNTSLSGVSIRGDDVVKTIQDITNSSDVYAVDQRFLAQTLMRTSSTLQANGESYNYAQKMANGYTKALSSEAPEWMKIVNSFDITKEIMNNRAKDANGNPIDELTEEMATKLDKAKPGLSKKVNDLLKSGYSEYDISRTLGETLGDTELGMTFMSKKIVDLGKSSITNIKQQFNVSYMQAEEMYKAALRTQEVEENTRILKEGSAEEQEKLKKSMFDTLNMSMDEINAASQNIDSRKQLIELYSKQNAIAKAGASIKGQRTEAIQKQDAIVAKLNAEKGKLERLKSNGASASAIELQKNTVKDLTEDLDRQTAIVNRGREDGGVGDVDKLKKTTEEIKDKQTPTAVLTGDFLKAEIEKLSSPLGLLSAASLAYFATSSANQILQNIFLAKIAEGNSATKAALETGKEVYDKAKGVRGAVNNILKHLPKMGVAGGVGTAGLLAASIYAGHKFNESDTGKSFSEWVTKDAAISDEEAFALAEKNKPKVQRNPNKHRKNGVSTNAPSDKARESLIKANTDSTIQQAKAVQQATQTAATQTAATQVNSQVAFNGSKEPSGSFGNINPDGSVMLKIDNFMGVVATAMSNAKIT